MSDEPKICAIGTPQCGGKKERLCFIKRRGRKETEVDSREKDIFESKMNGNEISKEEYDEFR